MNILDIGKNIISTIFNATPVGAAYNLAQKANPQLPDPVKFVESQVSNLGNQLSNFSYTPAKIDFPNQIASLFGGGSEMYKTTEQQPVYPFRNFSFPQAVQTGSKALLENVLPAMIGTVPIPPATGWSLPRAIGTTLGFGGLQKAAGYSNEDVFNPMNLGLSFLGGGLKFGEQPPQVQPMKQSYTKQLSPQERLSGLIHQTPQVRELMARGYDESQARHISFPEYVRIVKEDIPPFIHESFQPTKFQAGEMLGKAEYQSTENMSQFNNLFKNWIGQRDAALTTAVEYGSRYKTIKPELAPEIIKYMENPSAKVSEEAMGISNKLRAEFNALHTDAKAVGLDIGFYRDYLYHIWKEDPIEVAQKYRGLSRNWGSRKIPTYEEGISLGLTPKYTHPAQILSEYVRRMESVKANLVFFKKLKSEGFIVGAGIGARTPGFEQIRAMGFPQSETIINGQKTIVGGYYAPKPIANIINNVFAEHDVTPILKTASKISAGLQDVTMSGGLPGTPLNAWTFAQASKEVLAGRVKGPLTAVVRSMVHPDEYFKENSQFIKEQQLNNISVRTTASIENLKPPKIFDGGLSGVWNRLVNEKTFKEFMPILQTEFYKDVRNGLVDKGISEDVAIQKAAQATKNFYGIVSSEKQIQSSATGNAVKSTFLFLTSPITYPN